MLTAKRGQLRRTAGGGGHNQQQRRRCHHHFPLLLRALLFIFIIVSSTLSLLFWLPTSSNSNTLRLRLGKAEAEDNPSSLLSSLRTSSPSQQHYEKEDSLLLLLHYKNYTIFEFWDDYKCEELFRQQRPIHNESTWLLMRRLYRQIVGPAKSSIPPDTTTTTSSSTKKYDTGFTVPFVVRQVPEKGRGVFFASSGGNGGDRVIHKGQVVYNNKYTANFWTANEYRKFIVSLPTKDLACDVLQWAYVYPNTNANTAVKAASDRRGNDDNNNPATATAAAAVNHPAFSSSYVIGVDLDEGSFCNDGGRYNTANIGSSSSSSACGNQNNNSDQNNGESKKLRKGGAGHRSNNNQTAAYCNDLLVALRDIRIGEEFECNYKEFSVPVGWKYFGLE